jgi:hypothetical protein
LITCYISFQDFNTMFKQFGRLNLDCRLVQQNTFQSAFPHACSYNSHNKFPMK